MRYRSPGSRAEGALADDNDAQIIAQVIAVGGTLLISSNLVMVRERMLQEWFDRHHSEWPGVQARTLVQRVDPWLCRWWRHEQGPAVYTRSALAAFWPEATDASPGLVRAHTEEGLAAMARGHFPEFAPQVLDYIRRTHDLESHVESVRRTLPLRTRQAEAERRSMLLARPDIEHEAALYGTTADSLISGWRDHDAPRTEHIITHDEEAPAPCATAEAGVLTVAGSKPDLDQNIGAYHW